CFDCAAGRELARVMWRRGHELAEAAIGIEIVDFLRVGPEAEITVEGEVTAPRALARLAHLAGTAGPQRVHIDALPGFDSDHLGADLDHDTSWIETEDRRQLGQRQMRNPLGPVGEHVAEVGTMPQALT